MKNNYLNIVIVIAVILIFGIPTVNNLLGNLKSLKGDFSQLWQKGFHKDVYKNTKLDTARQVKYLNNLEKDVILELNKVRSNPPQYAQTQLTEFRTYYQGNIINYPGHRVTNTEGLKAVDECINVLLHTKPMPLLTPSNGLSKAAKDMIKDQSPTINTGHKASDGSMPADRMNRYGNWLDLAAENIDYGNNQADLIVLALLIDDNVPDRGHRENILNGNLKVVGVASGTHKLYRYMFMMDFAGAYKEKT